MGASVKIQVKCPVCNESLMNSGVGVDDLPSIELEAKVGDKEGHIYLSQVYGSYHKAFENVDDIEGSVAEISCPHCHGGLPQQGTCACKAPIVSLSLHIGGIVKFCARNGCQNHSLEFEDVETAFRLFQSQDDSSLA